LAVSVSSVALALYDIYVRGLAYRVAHQPAKAATESQRISITAASSYDRWSVANSRPAQIQAVWTAATG